MKQHLFERLRYLNWEDVFKVWTHRSFLRHAIDRVYCGVSHRDEWSLDGHLQSILLQSLPNFKNDGRYGYDGIGCSRGELWTPRGLTEEESQSARDLWDMKIDAVIGAFLCDDIEDFERQPLAWHTLADMMGGMWW